MSKPPFYKSVTNLVSSFGISADEAVQRVQAHYKYFKDRNDRLMERQNDAANSALNNLNNQSVLVATAVLTFSGAFVGVVYKSLTVEHLVIFFVIAIAELLALTLALVDYLKTNKFHNAWAKMYVSINQDVDSGFANGTLQDTSQLGEIESKYLRKMVNETNQLIPALVVFFTMAGAWIFLLLLFTYFIDMPFYSGHLLNAIN